MDFYNRYHDRNPVNIIAAGESRWDGGKAVYRPHSDMSAIELTLEGEGVFTNNGQTYLLHAGDVFILRRGTTHGYTNAAGQVWHKLYVTLSGELIETLFDAYLPENEYVYHGCDVEKNLRTIYETAQKYRANYPAFLEAAMPEVLRLLMRLAKCGAEQEEPLPDRVRAYLDAHIEYPLVLDHLTREFGYSKNHIINTFKNAFGCTPYQYYTERKLSAAKFFLANTDLSVGALSDRLAFSDAQYFSAWFKANSGLSPTRYRQQEEKKNGFCPYADGMPTKISFRRK